MTKYISLLRGINVGGKRKILMADSKELYSKLGYSNCISYIQSGNVIFESKEESTNDLASKIEETIKNEYGFDVPVIVKTRTELEKAVQDNPYAETKEIESLCLSFLNRTPDTELVGKISNLNFSPDEFQIANQNVFIFCPGPYHKTKLSNQFFESKLKVRATTRNWKTVLKLMKLSE